MNCQKCNNTMRRVPKKVYLGMGRYRTMPSDDWECPYCIWKGDAGPGALLKEIIKQNL